MGALSARDGTGLTVDEEFQEIADAAIESAENVQCSLKEFVAGLETIFDALRNRLEEAKEEAGE